MKDYYITSAEKLILEQSKLEGKLQGWREAWAGAWEDGIQKGRYELLNFLVQHKFGSTAAAFYSDKMKTASAFDMQELCKKIMLHQSVESVFE